ncbi:MFS transporter [Amycolatopsis silviterrae]|uniref:MFS transporter n=1 Tax=Amycolatopsis silviterrae TaxID=1656914 RepID=A0ABW5H3M3_9PSEU
MTATTPARADTGSLISPAQRKSIVAACVGNFIEWYEFVLYGYFASTIAKLFFPAGDATAALLLTFALFGVSFVVRPLGGVVFGYIGDRHGRRGALAAIILMISVGTALMAVVPPYASIGVAAPILILVLRLVQGLSAGGEWTGAVAYVIETAPAGRRAYYGSWQTITIVLGMMAASLSALLFTEVLSPAALLSWGWRVPFLIALPIGLVGLYLRLKLDETPEFARIAAADAHERTPLRATLRHDWRSILRVAGLVCSPTMCTYVLLVYGPTFLVTDLEVPPAQAKLAGFAAMAVLMVVTVVFARWCDRVGRKPFLVAGAIWVLVTAPLGFLLLHQTSFGFLIAGLGIVVIGEALMLAPQPAVFAELFPTERRYSGLGIGYNLGVVLFGGAGPLVATAIVEATHSTYAPAGYLAFGALVSLIAAVFTPETLPSARKR